MGRSALPRFPSYLLPCLIALVFLTALFLYKADRFASQTKTVAGHNLEPTPWHLFPPRTFNEETWQSRAYKIIQCSYLACPNALSSEDTPIQGEAAKCPEFFGFIHRDLEPWAKMGITKDHLARVKDFAAFRVVISKGRLYLDLYYACVQSRMMFTRWGLLQLLRRYPRMVPDVDMMFDCMDKPTISRAEHGASPLPLFRGKFKALDVEFQDIKQGSQAQSWSKKRPLAFWKGNPYVDSPICEQLLQCNHSRKWGTQIMQQDWVEEAKGGYEKSKLSSQCDYRYKIYAEGFAWSVSLKYILSCSSLALIISPQYEDFFSRGLVPKKNYWPVSAYELCKSIKFAVSWGNKNPSEAQAIGKGGQDFMESLSMDRVYDYMFHLIMEYSKLLDFKPTPPSFALEVCTGSLLCLADPIQKQCLQSSTTFPSPNPPCTIKPANGDFIDGWIQRKQKIIEDIREMEMLKA